MIYYKYKEKQLRKFRDASRKNPGMILIYYFMMKFSLIGPAVICYIPEHIKKISCILFVFLFFWVSSSYCALFFSGSQKEQNPSFEYLTYESDIELADSKAGGMGIVFAEEQAGEDPADSEYAEVENKNSYITTDTMDMAEDEAMFSVDDILATRHYNEPGDRESFDTALSTSSGEDPVFSPDDWRLILVNKQHPIPDDYSFELGDIYWGMQCDKRILPYLFDMLQAAKDDGINLVVCSPYRNMDQQVNIFNNKINANMGRGLSYREAFRVSSRSVTVPGSSEHQMGLALDIVVSNYQTLDAGFAQTEGGKWLKEHSRDYGFIIRYPEDKEYITGIFFEPWHFRYVGVDAARLIMEEEICLEEFWDRYM